MQGFFDKFQSSVKFNLKPFWSFVISKRENIDFPSSVFLGNVETDEEEEIEKLFAIFIRSFPTILINSASNSYSFFSISKEKPTLELTNALGKMKKSKQVLNLTNLFYC